jgi:hypothetical protein
MIKNCSANNVLWGTDRPARKSRQDRFVAQEDGRNCDQRGIFTDKTMTLAAIDRLVHHATILETNVESYRRKAALKRKRGKGD